MTNFDIYIVNHTKSIIMKHLQIRYLKQIIKKDTLMKSGLYRIVHYLI